MNSLNKDLTNVVVLLKASHYRGTEKDRLFLVKGGFGAMPYTTGRKAHGVFLCDGEYAVIDASDDIERLADNINPTPDNK